MDEEVRHRLQAERKAPAGEGPLCGVRSLEKGERTGLQGLALKRW